MGCSSSTPHGFGNLDGLNNENERGWSLSIHHVDHGFKNRTYEKTRQTRALLEGVLSGHTLFSTLGAQGLQDVVDAMAPVRVEAGETMIGQGAQISHLFVIEVGFLIGQRAGAKDPSRAKSFGSGAIIGEKAVLSEQTSQASYSNSSDSVVLAWRIDAATYRNILAANGERIAHRNRVHHALAGCPFLEGVEGHVLDQISNDAMQVTHLEAGAPLPGAVPRQRATHAWLVVKGKVFETMALRPDGGTQTKETHDEFVVAMNRRYEVEAGQLAATHSLLCDLPQHVGSASASRTGAEVIPIPYEVLSNGGMNHSAARLLVSDLFERVLTSKMEFAALPQAVIKLLVTLMPSRKYESGDIIMREGFRNTYLFLVSSGEISVTQSPVAGRLQRRKDQANARKAEREMSRSASMSFDNPIAASPPGADLEDMRSREAAEVIWERMRSYMKEGGMAKVHDLFKEIDADASGYIDKEEFKAALERMGIEGVSAKVVRRVMRTADPNGDGQLDFRELIDVLKPNTSARGLGAELDEMQTKDAATLVWDSMRSYMQKHGIDSVRKIFNQIDTDQSGAIDGAELQMFLEKMGIKDVSAKVLRRVVRSADPDGSGDIDLSELTRVLNGQNRQSTGSARKSMGGDDVETEAVADAVWKRMRAFAKQNGFKRVSQVFDEFDTDKSGSIDASEFAKALERMGIEGVGPKVLKAVILIVDKDGDGEIDLSELAEALKSSKATKKPQRDQRSSSSATVRATSETSSSGGGGSFDSPFATSSAGLPSAAGARKPPRRANSLSRRASSFNNDTSRTNTGFSYRKDLTEKEYLDILSDELSFLFGEPESVPQRVVDSLPEDGAQVEVSRLRCGDTLGVGLMKPLDDGKGVMMLAKGVLPATAAAPAAEASPASPRASLVRSSSARPSLSPAASTLDLTPTNTDGSVAMAESLVAATDCEVSILSRAVFMRALNVSRWILKRRLKDKEKRLHDAAAADAECNAEGNDFGGQGKSQANVAALAAVEAAIAKHGGAEGGGAGGGSQYGEAEEGHLDDDLQMGAHAYLSPKHWAWFSRREVRLSNLREVKVLGKGGFGLVRCVRDKLTGEEFALKALAKTRLKQQGMSTSEVLRERDAQVLCGEHPLVCQLFNTYEDTSTLYILLELQTGRELYDLIYKPVKVPLSSTYTQFLVANLLLALEHVHSKNFAFRDLKPENVMISENNYAKLIDFGFAKEVPLGERTFTMCGTPEYLAPEVILGTGHDRSADMWTLGVLAFECRAVATPFDALSPLSQEADKEEGLSAEQIKRRRKNAIMENIVSKKPVFSPECFDPSTEDRACVSWILGALAKDPEGRLTDAQAKGGGYLRAVNWNGVFAQSTRAPALR